MSTTEAERNKAAYIEWWRRPNAANAAAELRKEGFEPPPRPIETDPYWQGLQPLWSYNKVKPVSAHLYDLKRERQQKWDAEKAKNPFWEGFKDAAMDFAMWFATYLGTEGLAYGAGLRPGLTWGTLRQAAIYGGINIPIVRDFWNYRKAYHWKPMMSVLAQWAGRRGIAKALKEKLGWKQRKPFFPNRRRQGRYY